jgi:hypothetical protein
MTRGTNVEEKPLSGIKKIILIVQHFKLKGNIIMLALIIIFSISLGLLIAARLGAGLSEVNLKEVEIRKVEEVQAIKEFFKQKR